MTTRRDFLRAGILAGTGALLSPLALQRARAGRTIAATPPINRWTDSLIVPTVARCATNGLYPGADYYEIYMGAGRWQFSHSLPVTAPPGNTTWGYGCDNFFIGYFGPTIEARRGTPVVVKYVNRLPEEYSLHPLPGPVDVTVPDPELYPGLFAGRAVPHLHGGYTAPQFDGHPEAWFTRGIDFQGFKGEKYTSLEPGPGHPGQAVYLYSNDQRATQLWYHDHAMGMTRLNVYAGLAALYFVRDVYDPGPFQDLACHGKALPIPRDEFEVPLVIQDKSFKSDGSLFYPQDGLVWQVHPNWVPEFFGDTPVVNGKAFPVLKVQARRYRFRVLNACQARFLHISLRGPGSLPFWVIGGDQGFLPAPVRTNDLLLGPAERADIIVDFNNLKPGTEFILTNDANAPYPDGGGGPAIPELLKLVVVKPKGARDRTISPGALTLPPLETLTGVTVNPETGIPPSVTSRGLILKETMDEASGNPVIVRINQHYFMDPVEEKPRVNSTEVWEFINLTADAHPMHLHLVGFQVLNRQQIDVDRYTTDYLSWVDGGRVEGQKPDLASGYLTGPLLPPAPEETGFKDTAKAFPGQVLRVIAKFAIPGAVAGIPGSGVTLPADYVYHCHILEHEDNEMMRPFQVVASPDPRSFTGVEEQTPLKFALDANYPNPFNPQTTIRFTVPHTTDVQLKVFNAVGQEIATLAEGEFAAGPHAVIFSGDRLASGMYYARMQAGTFTAVIRMLLLR